MKLKLLTTGGAAALLMASSLAVAHTGYHHKAHAGWMPGDHPAIQTPGDAAKPRLGVALAALSEVDLSALQSEYGVRIAQVMEGSAAASAGLSEGDVVTTIDGRPVYSPERMQYLVAESAEKSTISVLRDGEAVELVVDYRPKAQQARSGKAILGIRIQEMTADLKEAFGTEGRQGVLISQVVNGSAAEEAGLKAGDVVVALSGSPVEAVDDVLDVIRAQSPGEEIELAIVRDRQPLKLNAVLDSHPLSKAGKHHGYHGHTHHGHSSHGMIPGHHCGPGKTYRKS